MKMIDEISKDGNKLTRIILGPTVWLKYFHHSGDVILNILFKSKHKLEFENNTSSIIIRDAKQK